MSFFEFGSEKKAVKTTISVELPVIFIKEDSSVVAYTPALDISTIGKDEKDAKSMFEELLDIYFKDLIENGTVDTVLRGLGWTKGKQMGRPTWVPPKISQESFKVEVPMAA